MAHFAKIENGVVTQVIVAEHEFINSGVVGDSNQWKQTSYNTQSGVHKLGGTPLRGNYAGVGYVYDAVNDVFYPSQPYPSWILNNTTWTWEAPVDYPTGEGKYTWNETTTSWDAVTE